MWNTVGFKNITVKRNYLCWYFYIIIHVVILIGSQFLILDAFADRCRVAKLTDKNLSAWFNPVRNADDIVLPIPIKMKTHSKLIPSLVFQQLRFSDSDLFSRNKNTYEMGAAYPEPFENNLRVRVAPGRIKKLLIGKYEISKAQYALVMGRGHLFKGLEILRLSIGDRNVKILNEVLDKEKKCHGKISKKLHRYLAEPVTFLPLDAYLDFVDVANALCISYKQCKKRLMEFGDENALAFLRLPQEFEWEFVARGGKPYLEGNLTRANLQSDQPSIEVGKSILSYAHLGGDPARLLPIGSRDALYGIHDMMGNAQELMQNRFTSENGFGAVGGVVARGSSYITKLDKFRISRRVELTPFRRKEDSGKFFEQSFPLTGMRLVVGHSLGGIKDIRALQAAYAKSYISLDDLGDGAGDKVELARDLGTLDQREIELRDELGDKDRRDYYKFILRELSTLKIAIDSGERAVVSIVDAGDGKIYRTSIRKGKRTSFTTPVLTPNRAYFLKVEPKAKKVNEFNYELFIEQIDVPDTGVSKIDQSTMRFATGIGARGRDFRGFVGRSDPIDIYPVRMDSGLGGLKISLGENTIPLSFEWLDVSGNVIEQLAVKPQSKSKQSLVVLLPKEKTAFARVKLLNASSNSHYSLKLVPVPAYDNVFGQTVENAKTVKFKSTHSGVLSSDIPKLFTIVSLSKPSELEIILKGLGADADLSVYNAALGKLQGINQKTGNSDEVFKRIVNKGKYIVSVKFKGAIDQTTPFQLKVRAKTKSLADLPQRELALSRIKKVSKPNYKSTQVLKSGVQGAYFRIAPGKSGEYLMKVQSLSNVELDLSLEDVDGTVFNRSKRLGSVDYLNFFLASHLARNIYIHRPIPSKKAIKFIVSLEPVPDQAIKMESDFGKFRGLFGDWYLAEKDSVCFAFTLAKLNSIPLGNRKPFLMFGAIANFPNSFRHNVAMPPNFSDTAKVRVNIKGRWRKMPSHKKNNAFLWLTKPCPNSCNVDDVNKMIKRGRELEVAHEGNKMLFSLKGARAAVKASTQLCRALNSYLWE